jgi:transcriptional regulator with XRE-family HTH domain
MDEEIRDLIKESGQSEKGRQLQERIDHDLDEYLSRPDVKGEFRRLDRQKSKKGTTLSWISLMAQMNAMRHPTLTEQLIFLIKEQGWSQTALGEFAGIAPSVLSRFMSGESSITIDTVDRLFRSLRLEVMGSDSVLLELAVVKDRRKKKAPGKNPEGGKPTFWHDSMRSLFRLDDQVDGGKVLMVALRLARLDPDQFPPWEP